MSSTAQATSTSSNVQLIVDAALADYAEITGIDLSKSPFAAMLEQANTPEAILALLQERQKAFKTYRDRNRRLIRCLSPAVEILQAFSGIFGAVPVSHERHMPP
jgi:fungal STAND N-terminal Goodbye domain